MIFDARLVMPTMPETKCNWACSVDKVDSYGKRLSRKQLAAKIFKLSPTLASFQDEIEAAKKFANIANIAGYIDHGCSSLTDGNDERATFFLITRYTSDVQT